MTYNVNDFIDHDHKQLITNNFKTSHPYFKTIINQVTSCFICIGILGGLLVSFVTLLHVILE
jgi:hypothetical protein